MLKNILATYQIVHAFQRERGPFKLIETGRARAFQAGINQRANPNEPAELELLLQCPHCLSFWVALAVTFILPQRLIGAMAIWGGASQLFHLWQAFNDWRFAPPASTSASAPPPNSTPSEEAKSLVGLRAVVYIEGTETIEGIIETQICACQTASGQVEYGIRLADDSTVQVTRDLFLIDD
jgi:hypothetical protein